MASKQEKTRLGLDENATDEQIEARIAELLELEELVNAAGDAAPGEPVHVEAPAKIAMISKTGQERRRGGLVISPSTPLVVAIADLDPKDLAVIEADEAILTLRTDSPVTETLPRYNR